MRKTSVLIITISMLVLFTACAPDLKSDTQSTSEAPASSQTEVYFKATVLEISGNSVLVEPLEGESIRSSADKITFSKTNLDNIGAAVGDIVSVAYSGEVMESYPGQIIVIKWSMFQKKTSGESAPSSSASQSNASQSPACSDGEWSTSSGHSPMEAKKPVIYLYPEKETDVSVRLDFDGRLDFTYPRYNGGWNVAAYPGGRIVNKADGGEYSYLFWEGTSTTRYDLSRGFVVKGGDTVAFLREKLEYMGLTPKEYNEFIVYWAPLMENNPYNLIAFQGKEYTDSARLTVSPEPDSVLRVFMAYKPLDKAANVPAQQLPAFERKGFTVVEWGGVLVE